MTEHDLHSYPATPCTLCYNEPMPKQSGAVPRTPSPISTQTATSHVELFAGAGGLGLGLALAGMRPSLMVEINKHAADTLRRNSSTCPSLRGVLVEQADVGAIDWSTAIHGPVHLLSAGPPCQPFSQAGKHRAHDDHRDQFPATLRAVRELLPEYVLIENVYGLVRPTFSSYFAYILDQFRWPGVVIRENEVWNEHHDRILQHAKIRPPAYIVHHRVVNAADFGVPQSRSRLVIIASRADVPIAALPEPTHSREGLLAAMRSGQYWSDLRVLRRDHLAVATKSGSGVTPDPAVKRQPWRTVRQGLIGLDPAESTAPTEDGHWLIEGARLYRGHKGSDLDWPAKTIKAGVHGVGGGENVVHLDDGRYRYFTLREMARLQGFPDDYLFAGPRSRVIGQIGNAVPVMLAHAIGKSIAAARTASASATSTTRASRP